MGCPTASSAVAIHCEAVFFASTLRTEQEPHQPRIYAEHGDFVYRPQEKRWLKPVSLIISHSYRQTFRRQHAVLARAAVGDTPTFVIEAGHNLAPASRTVFDEIPMSLDRLVAQLGVAYPVR